MEFRLHPLRFCFTARDPIYFAPGESSNTLRGALGSILRQLACSPGCTGALLCQSRSVCPYARLFEPSAVAPPGRGLDRSPRPFVFRARHLDGVTVTAGDPFYFDFYLFDSTRPPLAYLISTFAQLARQGLGPGRRNVELTGVWQLNQLGEPASRLFDSELLPVPQPLPPLELSLLGQKHLSQIQIRFLTPTELKCGQQVAPQPDFPILIARVLDRISNLRELYGEGALTLDLRGMQRRAALVRTISCDLQHVTRSRRSSRTGQVHPLGGFIGIAQYAGDLSEFLPFLQVAVWTGVGRQTVWGKGVMSLHEIE